MMNPEDLKISEYPPRCGLQGKVSSGISVEHISTGTCIIVTRHRSQHRNKSDALRALAAIFEEPYKWPNP
jgi:protein subunit release factor A